MASGTQVGPRFSAADVARFDALVDAVNAGLLPGQGRVDRGALVRILALDALPRFEERHGIAKLAKRGRK